jgi:hypothetical protein
VFDAFGWFVLCSGIHFNLCGCVAGSKLQFRFGNKEAGRMYGVLAFLAKITKNKLNN